MSASEHICIKMIAYEVLTDKSNYSLSVALACLLFRLHNKI